MWRWSRPGGRRCSGLRGLRGAPRADGRGAAWSDDVLRSKGEGRFWLAQSLCSGPARVLIRERVAAAVELDFRIHLRGYNGGQPTATSHGAPSTLAAQAFRRYEYEYG